MRYIMGASAEMLPQIKIVCYFNHNIKNSVKVRKVTPTNNSMLLTLPEFLSPSKSAILHQRRDHDSCVLLSSVYLLLLCCTAIPPFQVIPAGDI